MVRGIDKFREFFKGFEQNYIMIGGAACDVYETQYAQIPRATKDLDIILIVEALSAKFVSRFWEFIKLGKYSTRQKGESETAHEYFRFLQPEDNSFPAQLELFSRKLELINFSQDMHLTPIPVDEELSSLSAILMDEPYYNYTIEHSSIEQGIHLANIESLISLKARAYIDIRKQKESGTRIDSKNIIKHKNDIFRLGAMLSLDSSFKLPQKLQIDLALFCNMVAEELPNANFFKNIGLPNTTGDRVFQLLKSTFNIE